MKIRWRLRFKNPTTILSMLGVLLTLAYTVLDTLGIIPKVADGTVNAIFVAVMQILALLGVTIDPTTKGLSDSAQALTYTKPAPTKETQPAENAETTAANQPAETKSAETQTSKPQTAEAQTAEPQTAKTQTAEAQTAEPKTAKTQTAEDQLVEDQTAEVQSAEAQTDTTESVPPAFEFGTAGSQIRFYPADEETASSASQNTDFKPE